MRKAWPWILAAGAGTLGVACNAILGLEPPPSPGAGGGATGGTGGTGAAPVCAAIDAMLPPGATVEAGTYSPFGPVVASDAGGNWDFFDLSVFSGSSVPNFTGGTFDGQYVYFTGRGTGMLRYDTQGTFSDPTAWEHFDVSKIKPPNAGGFSGAVLAGRFVYFIPEQLLGSTNIATMVARYDRTGDFANAASWASFDVTTMAGAGADAGGGYVGGVTDGAHLYLVPNHDAPNNGGPDGRVVRYVLPTDAGPPLDEDAGTPDSGADAGHPDGGGTDAGSADAGSAFADPAPWSAFDLGGLAPEALGFSGAVYDGTNIYLVPQTNGAFGGAVHGGNSGTVARFRTESAFDVPSSWSFFDVTNVQGLAYDFVGGAFDGRYVYLVPHAEQIVLRYDTKGAFGSPSGWSWYDASRVAGVDGASTQYAGGAFDGRFVYFVPSSNGFGQVLRYDTLSTFTADCAWSTADLGSVVPTRGQPGVYNGAVFDGEYLYLIPSDNSFAARFRARTPASLPSLPQFHGSFW